MIIVDCEQGTDEWKLARLGIPTASCFGKIVTPKGKPSTQRHAYMCKLLAEWLSGEPTEGYKGEWMERGNKLEADARSLYELIHGVEVRQVGVIYKDEKKLIACSPDGLPPKKGFEAKCPKLNTHIEYLLTGEVPAIYWPQIQGGMLVTELDEWDFMSYFPGLPPLEINVNRDTRFIKLLADEMDCFVDEMLEKREQLEKMR